MKELRNVRYSIAFEKALSQDDIEIQNFLKSIYFQIPFIKTFSPEEKEKSFEKWYESFKENETFENFVRRLELCGKIEELEKLEKILKKYLPFQVKVVNIIRFIPL